MKIGAWEPRNLVPKPFRKPLKESSDLRFSTPKPLFSSRLSPWRDRSRLEESRPAHRSYAHSLACQGPDLPSRHTKNPHLRAFQQLERPGSRAESLHRTTSSPSRQPYFIRIFLPISDSKALAETRPKARLQFLAKPSFYVKQSTDTPIYTSYIIIYTIVFNVHRTI